MTTPYYADESVTLYHGDCLEVTEWLAADVLVTDPPYGIGWQPSRNFGTGRSFAPEGIVGDATTEARDSALEAWGATRPALVFGNRRFPMLDAKAWLIFEKPTTASGLMGNRSPWLRNWEPIFVCGDWPRQVPWRSAVVTTRWKAAAGYSGYVTTAGHSHAKPLDVMEALIDACPPGTVADPFAGSGSTLVAAKRLGRKAIGCEIEERYCEMAAKRLRQGVLDFGGAA